MSKGAPEVQETSQQRALAEFAQNKLDDYEKRWLPVQNHLAANIEAMGKPDSAVRTGAEGRAATDTTIKFAGAQDQLQAGMADKVGLGSSRAKLAIAGLGGDEAKSKGLNVTAADQKIDDAYTQSLGALAQIGQGQSAQVGNGLADQAQASAKQAEADADAALTGRMSTAKMVGQFAGYGLQAGLAPSAPGLGSGATFGSSPGAAASVDPAFGSGFGKLPAGTQGFGVPGGLSFS